MFDDLTFQERVKEREGERGRERLTLTHGLL